MDGKERIILALDVEHFQEAQEIVTKYVGHVGMFKVGKQLFTHCGPKIVDFIKLKNSRVFLDLKYHDIPNTVSKAAVEAAKLGVDMFNVHAMGGLEMMKATADSIHAITKTLGTATRPKVIAVTVLTSIDNAVLQRMGLDITVENLTRNLATLAREAGLDGVVAGGSEIELIRQHCGGNFLIVTPGVRVGEAKHDQKRTITPSEAVKKGASYIVLGRTVMESADPFGTLKKIAGDIERVQGI